MHSFFVDKRFHEYAVANDGKKISDIIKPLALYLPQFHRIPENDEWWGEGFTEWTNVKKAEPLYKGHYQPHVPHPDVGYYDLSDVEVMRKQADMAKSYGVYGFCFYYYHFAQGKRLLEKPINNWLNATDIDFPFCFAWANENWTRTWDGGNQEVIMPQDYDADNMLNMIREMIPAFKDKRYIKVDNKPVLFVYRAEVIPHIKELTHMWRKLINDSGFDGIWLISMQNFAQEIPAKMGFDAAAEFAPFYHQGSIPISLKLYMQRFDELSKHRFVDYSDVIYNANDKTLHPYPCIRCIAPSWDNTARRAEKGATVLYNTTPELFKKFFIKKIKETVASGRPLDGLLLINAWNEWGEGTHLEPDIQHGYQSLEIIKNITDSSVKRIDSM